MYIKFTNLLVIRLTIALLFLTCFQVNTAAAQKITLKRSQVSLETVFKAIEKQSGYNIFYNAEMLKGTGLVSVNLAGVALEQALKTVLTGKSLEFKIVDKNVILSKSAAVRVQREMTITGKVSNDQDLPVTGAMVRVKNTSIGTITDENGNYSIAVPGADAILVFSYIGFVTQEKKTGGSLVINLRLELEDNKLNEVVVTALGIKREEKGLGYAVTKIDGEEISKTAPGNWVNALSGKVPGLNISKAGAGPGGSVRITLRGQNSLDLDKGEPLLVIDGVPVSSGMIGNNGQSYGATGNTETPVDYGNALSEINPDDIKEVVVLRGPSAAALYGSRGASGAILITTKSNADTKGRFSVAFNSNVTFDNVLRYPDLQFDYGSGNPGVNTYYSFGASPDGVNTHSSKTWGPKFEGQQFYQYDPLTQQRGTEKTPWVADRNYTKDAFTTGVTYNNTLSMSGGDSKNAVRLSYNDQRNEYILPNTGYSFNRLAFSSNSVLGKFQITTRVNYYHKESDNLPLSGYNSNTYMYAVMYGQPNIPFGWQSDYWLPGQEDIAQNNKLNSAIDNPYFMLYENLNTLKNDRIFGNITASYALTKKMNFQVRGGIDQGTSFRTTRRPYSSERFATGRYQEQNVTSKEQNYDFLYKYDDKFYEDLGFSLSLGGSSMTQESQNNTITAERLSYPGLYTLANSKDRPLIVPQRFKKVVNSTYGLMQLNYKSYLFLDGTARNDWSSTLAEPYFYYSVSGSAVLSEMFDLSAIQSLSFLKLKASVAQVSHDTDPYSTSFYYSNSAFGGSYTSPAVLPGGANLKPEIITNREFGIDARFFKNRLNVDVTYYTANSKNQILTVPVDPGSGASGLIFNAGLINNSGWETAVGIDWLGKNSKLKWKTNLTWYKNKSEIKALTEGVESIIMASGPRGYIEARVGGKVGDIYGSGYLRSPDGQIVHDASGYPLIDTENMKYIGSAVADWKGGIQNQLTYKNWSFSFLFDGQRGGKVYSFSNSVLAGNGKTSSTLPGRYDGIIGEGVQRNADGTFRPNDIRADAPGYYTQKYLRDNVEANTFDASYIKLREANLEFKFGNKLIRKIKFLRAASFSLYGRDLLLFTKFPLYDPEIGTLNKNRIEPGFETGQFPSTRSFGALIKASF